MNTFIEGLEDGGYDCELVNMEPVVKAKPHQTALSKVHSEEQGPFLATFSVGGMTCASCVGNVSHAMSELEGVSDVAVNLVGKSATALLANKDLVKPLVDAIEDGGYDAELVSIEPIKKDEDISGPRSVSLRVDGMFCQYVFSFFICYILVTYYLLPLAIAQIKLRRLSSLSEIKSS